ncbi:MAG: AbgT family transporter [Natronosporangium sp.]
MVAGVVEVVDPVPSWRQSVEVEVAAAPPDGAGYRVVGVPVFGRPGDLRPGAGLPADASILAPVFIPLFLRLDVAPQTVLAAYRIGDSPTNVITPLMVYLPFIVLLAQKYRKDAGVGTVVSLMIPYTIVVAVAWTLFFIAWYFLGIPLGPGAPVEAS